MINSFMTEVPIETSPLICKANQCAGFYVIGTSVMRQLTIFIKSSIVNVWQGTIDVSEKCSYFVGNAHYSIKHKLHLTWQMLYFWYSTFEEIMWLHQARWFYIITPRWHKWLIKHWQEWNWHKMFLCFKELYLFCFDCLVLLLDYLNDY